MGLGLVRCGIHLLEHGISLFGSQRSSNRATILAAIGSQ